MQVAQLDMTNNSHQCPLGTRLRTDLILEYNKTLCGIGFAGPGCSSTTFGVHGIGYTQVCGKIIAYQDSTTDAFGTFNIVTRNNPLMVTMLMASVSLMGTVRESIFGHLQVP